MADQKPDPQAVVTDSSGSAAEDESKVSPIKQTLADLRDGGLKFTDPLGEGETEEDAEVESDADAGTEEGDEEGEAETEEEEADEPGAEDVPDEAGSEGEDESDVDDGDEGEPEEPEEEPEAELELASVEGPARAPGEKAEVRVHPDDLELVQQWANNGMRRAEFNKNMEPVRERQREIVDFIDQVETDPVGFVNEKVVPGMKRTLVLEMLLSDDALRENVMSDLNEIEADPAVLRSTKAELRADQAERRQEISDQKAANKRDEDAANEVIRAVDALIPENADDGIAQQFFDDALIHLGAVARSDPSKVTPQTVPELLAPRLRLYGLDADTQADGADSEDAVDGKGTKPAKKAKKPSAKLVTSEETAKKLAEKSNRKRAAGAGAVGAGAGASKLSPPPKQNVKERLKWYKEHVLGQKSA